MRFTSEVRKDRLTSDEVVSELIEAFARVSRDFKASMYGKGNFIGASCGLKIRYIRDGCRFQFVFWMAGVDFLRWDVPIARVLQSLGVERRTLIRNWDEEAFRQRQESIPGVEEKPL